MGEVEEKVRTHHVNLRRQSISTIRSLRINLQAISNLGGRGMIDVRLCCVSNREDIISTRACANKPGYRQVSPGFGSGPWRARSQGFVDFRCLICNHLVVPDRERQGWEFEHAPKHGNTLEANRERAVYNSEQGS